MKRMLKWAFLLNKRLYKKATFLVIPVMVVAAVVLLQLAALQGSGFVRILLVQQDPTDDVSSRIVADCMADSKLIAFTTCDSADEAIAKVKSGEADAVWIFPGDMQTELQAFVSQSSDAKPFVTVVEREHTIPLRLAQEKLSSVLYQHCAPSVYVAYIRNHIDALTSFSDTELMRHYDNFTVNGELFAFSFPNTDQPTENVQSIGYLLAPVRGLLSVLVVLCGLAAAIFYMQDEQAGTYALVPLRRKPFAAFGSVWIAVCNVAVVMLVSLLCVGMHTSIGRECLVLLLYTVCCTLFCMVLQQICNSIRVLGTLIPLLIIVMIGICPVFFELNEIAYLQLLFPPTYYINAIYNDAYLRYMLVYSMCLAAVYLLARKLPKHT